MSHSFLQTLSANEWSLVRGTGSSQKFKVMIPERKQLCIDLHYTLPNTLNVSIAYVGGGEKPGRHLLDTIMNEVAEIALKTGYDYAVIDYTLVCGVSMSEGNYTINERQRKTHKL
jgi:hypothetical protein